MNNQQQKQQQTSLVVTAGSWVSHLRQFITRSVIQPHIITAGEILGARAVPCDAAALLGVAWAIVDAPKFYKESAVAILQVIQNSAGVGPARYATWCLLDCCARVAAHTILSNGGRNQNNNSNNNLVLLQQLFLEEIERALPALIATHMPLSGVADPTIIDVDEEDSHEAIRIKARLERRCFRRLYLEILNGWIRDPWFSASLKSSNNNGIRSRNNSNGVLQKQIVDHVLVALCGTKSNNNNNPSSSSFLDSNNNMTNQQSTQNFSATSSNNSSMKNLFSPEYFIKQEPGLANNNNANGSFRNMNNNSSVSLAAVKREGGGGTGGGSSALSQETLSKVLDLVYATTNTSNNKNSNATTTSSASNISATSSSSSFVRKHESTSGGATIQRFFDAAHKIETDSIINQNSATATTTSSSARHTAASILTSKDLLDETRRQVSSIINELSRNTNAASRTFKCAQCGTVFPNENAKNNHSLTHFASRSTVVEERSGQKQLLHRLPPPSHEDFINYLGDADSGTTATLYVTDSEYQNLVGHFKTQQHLHQQQMLQKNSFGNNNNNSALNAPPQSFSAHPKLVERFSKLGGVTSAVGGRKKIGENGNDDQLDHQDSSFLMNNNANNNNNKRNVQNNNNNNNPFGGNNKTNSSNLVFVQDPLVRRTCFKCAKEFEPKQHPTRGWYLDECVEAVNPQDGQIGIAHKHCVY